MPDRRGGDPIDASRPEDDAGAVRPSQAPVTESNVEIIHTTPTTGDEALGYPHQPGEYADADRSRLVRLDAAIHRSDGRCVRTTVPALRRPL